MATPILKSGIDAEKVVSKVSRYANQAVVYYGEQKFLTFDTYVRPDYKLTGAEQVMLITKGTEYRPDLVSFDYFGTPDVWWKIMEINGMKDIWEFKAGKTIILPNSVL